ncbi:MAG: aminotransferase class V-fold PLP-dependent enzyme [Acidobacteria bacterium]|nr:aminotransferase class V-fold PLP-dependent enzyme [Acidobacteriota bacterium]
MNRRHFLAATLAAPAAAGAADDFSRLRADFPRALNETYFNSAAQHPLGNHTVAGMQRYMDYLHKGPGEGREDFWETGLGEVKPMFARLIGAKPDEIAFAGSTTVGENFVVNGLNLRGGNVVTNDLHYSASLANYLSRAERGLDVRIVKHTDWHTDPRAMERVVDKKTKLIAVSWISSVNGHAEDLKALSDLAHAHGAYLYADIIQGTGATPLDVHAAGVDFASCAMYKWLQGEHGCGFLYVREGLAESVLKPTELTGHPDLNYSPWTAAPQKGQPEFINHAPHGAGAFEVGTPSVITYAGQHASFRYMEKLGVDRIHAHAAGLLGRLRKELGQLGYTPITPDPAPASILTVLCPDPAATRAKIEAAIAAKKIRMSLRGPNSALTLGRFGNHMRFSVSVFNNQDDVDQILSVLS